MAELLYQRDVYGKTLIELGKQDKNIVVMDADLSSSTRTCMFCKEFPDRFFNVGVAEQNMMTIAAGLASCSKTVFVSIFRDVRYRKGLGPDKEFRSLSNNFDIKIVASHAGVSVGPDGASHQALEDISLMRIIPNMNIIVPCDGPQTKDAVLAAASAKGPFYIRIGRAKVSTIEGKGEFKFGKAQALKEGNDVAILACGIMVHEGLLAAGESAEKGIKARVINIHTVKPLDTKVIIDAARTTKGIVVCEEHTTIGGLASSVDEVVSENHPTRVMRVGIRNRFGQSGEPEELLKEYNITAAAIENAALSVLGK